MVIIIQYGGAITLTSEVLIMTPSAVAMAADSVITVNGNKTYEGVNKLFMLSNNPPRE